MGSGRQNINRYYRTNEELLVRELLSALLLNEVQKKNIHQTAIDLIKKIRESSNSQSLVSQLMNLYQLSSPQGISLMCMAEALLRIPDDTTADKLISDKVAQGDWKNVDTANTPALFKSTTAALKMVDGVFNAAEEPGIFNRIKSALGSGSMPVIRGTIKLGMKVLADQFVLGTSIEKAMERGKDWENKGYNYSYDMLGEAALTQTDANRYFESYAAAIDKIGKHGSGKTIYERGSISIKLSALHPRYEFMQHERVVSEVTARLLELATKCKEHGISLTVDAEEADVLELSLDIIEHVATHKSLAGWNGFGLAVQAYQKRAVAVIDWFSDLAKTNDLRLHVRLVKGAYWDTEIKRTQERGFEDYPVFTRKAYTDLSYTICAQQLFKAAPYIYPMFATHNAHTVATILELADTNSNFEFQKLHGMGDELYDHIVGPQNKNIPCRIYAPVGSHHDLLPYLVRRLLENGANTSFVHHLTDARVPVEDIVADPFVRTEQFDCKPHKAIPLPVNLYGHDRPNSHGIDLSDPDEIEQIYSELAKTHSWTSYPIINGKEVTRTIGKDVLNPADHTKVGISHAATAEDVKIAFDCAQAASCDWNTTDVDVRAKALEAAAESIKDHRLELIALCVKEAGKTIPDAIAEVREAVDFCNYYAARAREDFGPPKNLKGPTGEMDQLSLHGRGTFVCISPWNFPMAIFTGQVAAALVSGNTVLAKPANPTQLIASYMIKLLHKAGIPNEVLHYVPGSSDQIGEALINHPAVSGVVITGSVDTAKLINKELAEKSGQIVPLIAETGGLNAMFVDSSALWEQVVEDVISSAFQSAGQRCSALRLLLIQENIADPLLNMLAGAMAELVVGNPQSLATDVGPIINANAQKELLKHIDYLKKNAREIYYTPTTLKQGTFVSPAAFEINSIDQLRGEKFGPILHVLRYKQQDLDTIIDQVNGLGFGLTLGVHSRISTTVEHIRARIRAGNMYVNRNMIGAVVGVQPFGGEGLSGTGPKAGGPHYLHRFAVERTFSDNITAQGGNTSLLTIDDFSS
jgi:RHH-type proline utilization regulon transcriptional repressor/proline dehydrogenase/delta 1-pyrroline-5-carboxylate dehydrogenase